MIPHQSSGIPFPVLPVIKTSDPLTSSSSDEIKRASSEDDEESAQYSYNSSHQSDNSSQNSTENSSSNNSLKNRSSESVRTQNSNFFFFFSCEDKIEDNSCNENNSENNSDSNSEKNPNSDDGSTASEYNNETAEYQSETSESSESQRSVPSVSSTTESENLQAEIEKLTPKELKEFFRDVSEAEVPYSQSVFSSLTWLPFKQIQRGMKTFGKNLVKTFKKIGGGDNSGEKKEEKKTGAEASENETNYLMCEYKSIQIYFSDYIRLEPKLFVTDAIILFQMEYCLENLTWQEREKIVIFDSFFYESYTNKKKMYKLLSEDPDLPYHEAQYQLVKRTLAKKNIFNSKMAFFLINIEDIHWISVLVTNLDTLANQSFQTSIEEDNEPSMIQLDSLHNEFGDGEYKNNIGAIIMRDYDTKFNSIEIDYDGSHKLSPDYIQPAWPGVSTIMEKDYSLLKAPQQLPGSNDCAIHQILFFEILAQNIELYRKPQNLRNIRNTWKLNCTQKRIEIKDLIKKLEKEQQITVSGSSSAQEENNPEIPITTLAYAEYLDSLRKNQVCLNTRQRY